MDLHSRQLRRSVRGAWVSCDILAVLDVRKEWNGPRCSKRMEPPQYSDKWDGSQTVGNRHFARFL